MRHRYVYATFTRGFSKSFLAVLILMIKAILYPGAKLGMASNVKNQSAGILSSKVDELCRLIPALKDEIEWDTRSSTAKTVISKDRVSYYFKNGSILENVAAAESSRGRRYQSILVEEAAQIDGKILNEVLLPMLNVERKVNGVIDKNEKLNRSQLFVTSAGYKSTFAYEKLIQMYCQMVVNPKDYFVFGGDFRISLAEGLLNIDDMTATQADSTYDDSSFEREFASRWSGTADGAFFDPEVFDKWRLLEEADQRYDGRTKNGYYIMGVDVGRIACTTEAVIMKVVPSADTRVPRKEVVNIFSFEEEHFGLQSIQLKRLFNRYKCKACVLDGNGLGIGLVDFLVTDQDDPETGETLYGWGVINDDPDEPKYKKFETENTVPQALYIVKMNRNSNSDLYAYVQTQLQYGKIRFLVPYKDAEARLLAMEKSNHMTKARREDCLKPFRQTDFLENQMLNLVAKDDLGVIVLAQANTRVRKDKFSAFIYAMLWCKMDEESVKRKRLDIDKFMFFS